MQSGATQTKRVLSPIARVGAQIGLKRPDSPRIAPDRLWSARLYARAVGVAPCSAGSTRVKVFRTLFGVPA
jgi:hypothetical protein